MELKQSVAFRAPVRLVLTSNGIGKTGLTIGDVIIVAIQKQDGVSVVKFLGPGDWFEIDPVNMPGVYDVLLSASDTDTLGYLKYSVASTLCDSYFGLLEIRANFEADTYNRLGTPTGISIAADIATRATQAQILSDATPFPGARIDVEISSRASAVALAAVQADTDDIQTRLPATLNAGRMRSHVEVMDTDVIGASQIAAGAIGVSEAPLLANLDVAVSTRAAPGDAMALTSAERLAIDAELSTAHGAGAWDGTVAPALVAAAVWDEVKAGHVAPGSFGEEEQSHATPTEVLAAVGLGLVAYDASTGTQVASRAAPGDAMDLIADAVDANALAADAIAEIDAELSSVHGAGSWEDAPAPPSKTTLVMVDESIGVLV